MTFKKTFCPSPWFHMRINNSGAYEYCRWANKENRNSGPTIKQMSPADYFQKNMSEIRQSMLNGDVVPRCHECHLMEQHHKISGRQRQLIKVGIHPDNFDKTLLSSLWFDQLQRSDINLLPQDWQIDLGNFCNSSCVFCSPESSSRLASEFKKLNIIQNLPKVSWTEDPAQLQQFIETIKQSPAIKYLHFIGGETLITPAFKKILKELISCGVNKSATIGFTTNLNCWDQEVVDILMEFDQVNLGVSIECADSLNDYVRWPSNIANVKSVLNQWLDIAKRQNWLIQIRSTPTWITVGRLLSLYELAWQHSITIESCNFLNDPDHLRISVLPKKYRTAIIKKMQMWVQQKNSMVGDDTVYNIRNPNTVQSQIIQDIKSYVEYLEHSSYQTNLLNDSVKYLKLLESNRKNSILDYLPEYEELLRSAGY